MNRTPPPPPPREELPTLREDAIPTQDLMIAWNRKREDDQIARDLRTLALLSEIELGR